MQYGRSLPELQLKLGYSEIYVYLATTYLCDRACGRLKFQCNGQAMSTTGYAYALGLTLEY
ncbi:hypothetical protein [Nostoc sp.]|uniref:hypothetical protein n=1 Tax=Nostoc sp. TaxID=1180 RepID=UPI002FF968B1